VLFRSTFVSGPGTGLGRDYTVFATMSGHVRFEHQTAKKKRVRIIPAVAETAAAEA
jgi:ribosomal protein L27